MLPMRPSLPGFKLEEAWKQHLKEEPLSFKPNCVKSSEKWGDQEELEDVSPICAAKTKNNQIMPRARDAKTSLG